MGFRVWYMFVEPMVGRDVDQRVLGEIHLLELAQYLTQPLVTL